MAAPEALLLEVAENDPSIGVLIASTGPLLTPYDALVQEDGWLVNLASTEGTAPFDDGDLPGDQRTINALLIACDYAVRRGASSVPEVKALLQRESPVGVTTNGSATRSSALAERLGVWVRSPSERPPSFARRRRAHAELWFPCDPVLSFQPRTLDWDMGDNSLSSFVVHNEGVGDRVTITGDVGERWAVEIGLPPSTPIDALPEIEIEVASMPSYLSGVSSKFDGQVLEVGWAAGEAPQIEQIAECFRVWTKALFDVDATDVRIAFAPPSGRAAELTEMRARARAFRSNRDAVIAGHPDPQMVVEA